MSGLAVSIHKRSHVRSASYSSGHTSSNTTLESVEPFPRPRQVPIEEHIFHPKLRNQLPSVHKGNPFHPREPLAQPLAFLPLRKVLSANLVSPNLRKRSDVGLCQPADPPQLADLVPRGPVNNGFTLRHFGFVN